MLMGLYTAGMREVRRSALVPYTPAQMFALVDDIERYGEFLPWVTGVEVLERTDYERLGRVRLSRAGLQEQFTTRNLVQPPQRVEMRLVDGPFKLLHGVWTFDPIGEPAAPKGTKVGLDLQFELKSKLIDLLLTKKIESSCDQVVNAFVQRARTIYGPAA
jgi:ribosome-associated toxin RatA of RatAB toxin-antitoxin module